MHMNMNRGVADALVTLLTLTLTLTLTRGVADALVTLLEERPPQTVLTLTLAFIPTLNPQP